MRRRSLILALSVVVVLLAGIGASLALLVRHEPAYYRRGAIPAGKDRYAWSRQFEGEMTHLCSALQQDELSWDASFTTDQINSYLQEGFLDLGLDEKLLPENISEPRVAVDEGRLRLGFRYGYGRWRAIITVDLRVWVAQGEANTVALELLGLHAGALPISAQSLLERMSDAVERTNDNEKKFKVDVSWYRHDGHPVALLRFGADQPRTTVHLKHVELKAGCIVLKGRSTASGAAPDNTASE